MNRFAIAQDGEDFRVVETAPGGRQHVIGRFSTEAAARVCLMQRLTAVNAVSLARWVLGKRPPSAQ